VAAPAAKRRSPWLVIGGIVLLLLIVCVVGVGLLVTFVFNQTQPVVNAGDAFMSALRDGNYDKAFDLCTTSVQQEVTDAKGLEDVFSSFQPASWNFTSRSIDNNVGKLDGTVSYKKGDTGSVHIETEKVGEAWKISQAQLK
jgi:hypothetical protein